MKPNNNFLDIKIDKPLHEYFVYIRDMKVKTALKENRTMRITIPQGSWLVNPKEWLLGMKIMQKEFLIPGRPMTLWGNYVTRGKKE